jgi:hypothetical protein
VLARGGRSRHIRGRKRECGRECICIIALSVKGRMVGAALSGRSWNGVRGRENDIPKKRQTDVDQEISTTPSNCVDTNGRNYLGLASAIDGSMMARGLTKQGDQDQEYRRNHTHLAC